MPQGTRIPSKVLCHWGGDMFTSGPALHRHPGLGGGCRKGPLATLHAQPFTPAVPDSL